MNSKINLLCLFALCSVVSAANVQYGLNAFARPTLASLFNVRPRIRTLKNDEYYQNSEIAQQGNQMAQQANTCPLGGMVEPIHGEGNVVIETYCRCPSGTYGLTCQENFINPCYYGSGQYHPADQSLGPKYFIECNWNTPYLFKCPASLIWNQLIESCDWTQAQSMVSYNTQEQPMVSYNTHEQPMVSYNTQAQPMVNYNTQEQPMVHSNASPAPAPVPVPQYTHTQAQPMVHSNASPAPAPVPVPQYTHTQAQPMVHSNASPAPAPVPQYQKYSPRY